MKLSFSLAKTAAPKRKIEIQHIEKLDSEKREVVNVSQGNGILVEKSEEDIISESQKNLTIPVSTLYQRRTKQSSEVLTISHNSLRSLEHKSGIIAGDMKESTRTDVAEEPSRKKQSGSILMQIRNARERGLIQDAPESDSRIYGPEQFGWALLRGMGYDPDKDAAPDVTPTIVGNQGRLGLGVKPEYQSVPPNSINKI